MKNSRIIKSVLTGVLLLTQVLASQPVFAATILSITKTGKSLNAVGEQIESALVNCAKRDSGERMIFSKVGDREWCTKDIPTLCNRNKINAAKYVCNFSFDKKVEEYKNSQQQSDVTNLNPPTIIDDNASQVETDNQLTSESQASETQASETQDNNDISSENIKDAIALEKERIEAERQKLILRRQQLELNKRRLQESQPTSSN